MLDRHEREIYVNPQITHLGRRNFHTLHEVGHDILPWQRLLGYADDEARLSWATRVGFEREANQTAAELLFQRELFAQIASEYTIGIATVIELAEKFGSSIHAAFRRFVETHRSPMCGVVISCRPSCEMPLAYRRHEAMSSRTWDERFTPPDVWPQLLRQPQFPFLSLARQALVASSVETDWSYRNFDGRSVPLCVELFSNTYSTLILTWVAQRERLKRRRVIALA